MIYLSQSSNSGCYCHKFPDVVPIGLFQVYVIFGNLENLELNTLFNQRQMLFLLGQIINIS